MMRLPTITENRLVQETEKEILRKIIHAIGEVPKGIYSPSDDSFMLLEAIARMPVEGIRVLDIGTGSGILGLFCAARGAQVTATDIDDLALRHAQKAARTLGLGIQAVISDIFSNIDGRFELITFNPPYLPSSTIEDRTVDGGAQGTVLSKRFLTGLRDHLEGNGIALLLVSSFNDALLPLSMWNPQFDCEVLAKHSLFFEELKVLRVRLRDSFAR
jgi:release factor glutamine methyltransferase